MRTRSQILLLAATMIAVAATSLRAQIVSDGETRTLLNETNTIPGAVTVGTNGSFTLLVLSNNALLTNSANGVIGLNATANSNEVRLISSTARWRMGGSLFVGSNGVANRLVVSSGAFIDNNVGNLGNRVESSNNFALVTGSGSMWSNRLDLRVGTGGRGNQLTVSNGGWVVSRSGFVGNNASSSNNFALVTGSGSVWSNALNLAVGFSGVSNRLVIEAGGLAHCDIGTVGDFSSAINNEALVTGLGSRWNVQTDLTIGRLIGGNRLVVSNGAALVSGRNAYIGSFTASSNNVATVTGAGSVWSNQNDLIVGDFASGNVLIVSNGATVVSSNLFLGFNSASANNRVIVDGGTLRVTNAAGTSVLDVRRGSNVFNAGLVEVDHLVVTNPGSRFVFDGGTLLARRATHNNQNSFRVGNGVSPATFIMTGGGPYSFPSLIVAANAALIGDADITGSVIMQNGSTLTPGPPQGGIGKLAMSDSSILAGVTIMDIGKNGPVLTNDQVVVDDVITFTFGSVIVVTNIGPAALAAGDRFQLFTAGSFAGILETVSLPPLNSGLGWTNKLLVDGSIEVFTLPPPTVETLPASGVASDATTLNGVTNPRGSDTTAWFEYGFTTNYGNVTAPQPLGSGFGNTNFSAVLNGLFGGVTYHFRAVASNNIGVVFGTNQSFTLPAFADIGAGLTGRGRAAWGDYDNDGLLDIVFAETGHPSLARNTGTGFSTNVSLAVGFRSYGSAALGDYDNDGRLDALTTVSGYDQFDSSFAVSGVFRNTVGGFTNINAGLPRIFEGAAAWGDYDNDGRLDFLLTGTDVTQTVAQVWRNMGNTFPGTPFLLDTLAGLGSPPFLGGSAAWADFDNDGRLDVLLTGFSAFGNISHLWRNTGNGFSNINAGLSPVSHSSVAWGDYDNDGRVDILLTGATNEAYLSSGEMISQVWRNTGTGFTNINAGLPGVANASPNVAWGDYDNDGRLDILLAGATVTHPGVFGGPFFSNLICQVWRNTGNGFTNISAGLPGAVRGTTAWGDYDNDGRLDILISDGTDNNSIAQVWRNQTPLTNSPPTAPTGLSVTNVGDTMIFSWNASSDAQTPASGLTYNVRIGSTPGASDVMGPLSSSNGLRRLPQMGNAQCRLFARFNAALGTAYYWSVQAVDTAFAGSPFAPEQSFTINTVFTPTNGIPVPGDQNGDGVVSQFELAAVLTNLNGNGILTEADLDLVLSNYFATSPWLYVTNVAGLGGTNVTFALTNSLAGAFSVEYTTNLVDWYFLGPATPRYLFTDTNAPAEPQRYYRLRWP